MRLQQLHDGRITNQLVALSSEPDFRVLNHSGYILNGFKFRTKDSEKTLKTQNSGVTVRGDEFTGYADYYGIIKNILEVSYLENNSVILFKCDWFEAPAQGQNRGRGYKKDEYGYFSIDMTRLYYTNDPFVLASQAGLVYYVKDNDKKNWYSVVKVKPRNTYAMEDDGEDDFEPYQLNELGDTRGQLEATTVNQDEQILNRDDVNGLCLDNCNVHQEPQKIIYESDIDTEDEVEEYETDENDCAEDEDFDVA